jgi:hypothetical protein
MLTKTPAGIWNVFACNHSGFGVELYLSVI